MIYRWHTWLNMPKKPLEWHQQDMADEVLEYQTAKGLIMKWSELSDIVYTQTRGKWSGHDIQFPYSKLRYYVGCIYMYPKMTGRFVFFRRAGKKCAASRPLHEVRNPKKIHKLHHIAEKYDMDKEKFQKVCEKQLKYWILLP